MRDALRSADVLHPKHKTPLESSNMWKFYPSCTRDSPLDFPQPTHESVLHTKVSAIRLGSVSRAGPRPQSPCSRLSPHNSHSPTDFQESPWAKFSHLKIVDVIHGHRHNMTVVTFKHHFGHVVTVSSTSDSTSDCSTVSGTTSSVHGCEDSVVRPSSGESSVFRLKVSDRHQHHPL